MREQFEKLPEIANRLIAVNFNTTLDRYEAKSPLLSDCNDAALYLNGAWYAFREKQAIINDLKTQLECCRKENAVLLGKVGEGENRLKAVYALSRMRASVISSWKREELSIKVRKAISYLAKKEKALRGAND